MTVTFTEHLVHDCTVLPLSLSPSPPSLPPSLSSLPPSLSDLYWEQHYSQIPMTTSYLEETDRSLPEYPLPEQIERLIEAGKYSNVENRVTKVCVCMGGVG